MSTTLSGPGIKPRFMRRRNNKPLPVVIKSRRGQLGRRVRNIDKKIKKLQREQELGHKDTIMSAVEIANTGVFTLLNGLTQGDDDDNRHGNEVYATSVQGRFVISGDAAQLNAMVIRMILFWDQQSNGAAPALADLLDTTVITSAVMAPYHRDFQKRFKILMDKSYVINPILALTTTTGATDTVATVSVINIYKKFKRKLSRTVKYDDGNAGDITDIQTNALHVLFVSSVASNTPAITGGFRFYFKDA